MGTVSEREMAKELIELGRMKMEDGTDLEFKPINKNKRLIANQKCKEKNLSKVNNVDGSNSTTSNSFNLNSDSDLNWRSGGITDINSNYNSNHSNHSNHIVGNFGLKRKYPQNEIDNNLLWASYPHDHNFNSNSSSSVSPETQKRSLFDTDFGSDNTDGF